MPPGREAYAARSPGMLQGWPLSSPPERRAAQDEFVAARPARPLAGCISAYCGYWLEGGAPALHRGLPSPYLTVIFTLRCDVDVARRPDPSQRPAR
jgi:hypothetical protein